MNGFIKLHRQLIGWEWYQDMNVKATFLHLLLTVNFKDKRWKGILIKRGQILTSLQHLATDIGISVQKLRTALEKLESTNEITRKATSLYTMITVCNFDSYQDKDSIDNKRITNEQQADNKRITNEQQLLKNEKKERKEKEELDFLKDKIKSLKKQIGANQDNILKGLVFPEQFTPELIGAFELHLQMRRELKKPFKSVTSTQAKIKSLAKQIEMHGTDPILTIINKCIENQWIGIDIKYLEDNNGTQAKSENSQKENLNLETHILAHYKAVELKHYKLQGKFDRWNTELKENSFRLGNIAKGYKNKSFTTLFVFEACYMPLGNRLGGSSPKRKLEALVNWYKKLSDYNQNQGDMRKLFKDWGKSQSL